MATKEVLVSDTHLYNFTTANQCELRNGSAKSSVLWYFNPPIHLNTDDVQTAYFSVQHAEIPSSMYILPTTKTKLYITELGITTLYQINAGNYGINTFITAIQAQLPSRYSLTYSSVANTYTLTNTTNDFTIEATTTIGKYLGMNDTAISSTTKSVVFPNSPNFLPPMRLSICSNNLGINGTKTSSNSGAMFCSVQNNAIQLGVMYYLNYTGTRFILNIDTLNDFSVQLYNDDGEFVDLRNCDWSICIKVEVERWKSTTDLAHIGQ